MAKVLIEAPVFTIEAAMLAAEFGIDRLELCSDFAEGGETPSVGALAFLKEKLDIPIFVMIRPRGGDFIYSPEELYVMKKDIAILKSLGADGFVFGILKPDGHVDKESCKYLLKAAEDLPCTFHRAFDICKDKEKALEDIIDCGFKRILTSGGENDVGNGIFNILHWMDLVKDKIIIMPGGGLKPEHMPLLNSNVNLKEIHASCKSFRPSETEYRHPAVSLSKEPESFYQVLSFDQKTVKQFRDQMQ